MSERAWTSDEFALKETKDTCFVPGVRRVYVTDTFEESTKVVS